jgi:hypothetical protein
MKTIDATPKWIALNPMMLELASSKKSSASAKEHFDHMAKVADMAVDYEKKLVAIQQRIKGEFKAPILLSFLPDGFNKLDDDIMKIINK